MAGGLLHPVKGYRTQVPQAAEPIPERNDVIDFPLEGSFAMSRMLLLQSVLGHLALLEQKHPKKAASPVARRAKKYIEKLRRQH